ncbi:MAG: hypothetical protein K6A43_01200, partial [Treponema sp.]|nr:hypothetical protein [Treponema sp.]
MKKIWLIALIVLKALYAENAVADGSKDVYSDVGAVEKTVANLFWKNFRLEPYASWSSVLTKRESESSGAQTGSGGETFSGGAGEVFPGLDFIPGDLTLGAKLFVPFVEGRFYTKGSFWDEPFFESDFLQKQAWNFGLSVTDGGFSKKIPFVVKVGHLGAGGAFTKINNPVLGTSVNPFYASVGSTTAITANLPSSSSFSNPVSGFVQVSFGDKKKFFRTGTVNVFVRLPDFCESKEAGGTYAVSGLFKLFIPGVQKIKTSALNFGFAAGIFPFFNDDFYSEKSWFNKIRPFEEKSC